MTTETMHIGRKISRIRELRGMKQETLAQELGVSQQAVSKLEQSEAVDDDKLQLVAEKLGVKQKKTWMRIFYFYNKEMKRAFPFFSVCIMTD